RGTGPAGPLGRRPGRGGLGALPGRGARHTRLGVDPALVPDHRTATVLDLLLGRGVRGVGVVGHLVSSSSTTSASTTSPSSPEPVRLLSTSAAPVASENPAPAPAPSAPGCCWAYIADPIFWDSVDRVSILALMSSIEAPDSALRASLRSVRA